MNPPTLEEARQRLRELGYLDAGVDRLLFRPIFEGRGGWGVWLPAIGIGAFAGALASVAAIEGSEPGSTALTTAACVFLHLFLANLVPASLLALGLSFLADRSPRPGTAASAAGAGAAALVLALWILGTYALTREWSAAALLWGIPVLGVALVLAAAVRLAFLARAFARSGALPGRAARRIFAVAAGAGLVAALVLFVSRREPAAVPPPQPAPRPVPVVVIAIDGLDLDGAHKPAGVAALLSQASAGWWPARRRTPPELWTDLASGAPPARHGVRALTRVKPLGAHQSIRPPLGTSWYLRRLGLALGTVVSDPVSAADRRSLDFWEVAASSGVPSLAVGWWASAPWPGAVVIDNRAILAASRSGVEVDRHGLEAFTRLASQGAVVQTLYLPGCDIERDDSNPNSDPAGRAAAAARVQTLLEEQVARARRGEIVLIVLAADSHPSTPSALGRMVVFDGVPPAKALQMRPEDVAPSILARAGIPAARDLPGRPVAALFAPGSLEESTVAAYGPRILPPPPAAPESDREYLEKLRSLGYLK